MIAYQRKKYSSMQHHKKTSTLKTMSMGCSATEIASGLKFCICADEEGMDKLCSFGATKYRSMDTHGAKH